MIDPEPESGWNRRRILLLSRYERIAWELFAERGFREVTVDEIADAAGVSARTLFRYFPTKEDFLLGFTRRGSAELVQLIRELKPSETPFRAIWELFREHSLQDPPDVRVLTLWRQAAADAPEVHARVRGERSHDLTEAVAHYLGADHLDDPYPRILAGVIVGVESAVIEMWGRSDLTLLEILDTADQVVSAFPRAKQGGKQRGH
jgi:AcrR family transcriptional regulator